MALGSEIIDEKRSATGTPVVVVNPTDLTALIAAVNAIGSGAPVVPKSQNISTIASTTLPTNTFHSVTLIVRAGVVLFDGVSHPIGTYTWTAPMLKKLTTMIFDASGSTDAQLLLTQ
jgi:hypothetical protein